jgi:hypothetical protein
LGSTDEVMMVSLGNGPPFSHSLGSPLLSMNLFLSFSLLDNGQKVMTVLLVVVAIDIGKGSHDNGKRKRISLKQERKGKSLNITSDSLIGDRGG